MVRWLRGGAPCVALTAWFWVWYGAHDAVVAVALPAWCAGALLLGILVGRFIKKGRG